MCSTVDVVVHMEPVKVICRRVDTTFGRVDSQNGITTKIKKTRVYGSGCSSRYSAVGRAGYY